MLDTTYNTSGVKKKKKNFNQQMPSINTKTHLDTVFVSLCYAAAVIKWLGEHSLTTCDKRAESTPANRLKMCMTVSLSSFTIRCNEN